MMMNKLRSTFDSEVWTSVLASASEDLATERRTLNSQINTLSQRMENLLANMSYAKLQSLYTPPDNFAAGSWICSSRELSP